ncbi:UNVERIFIED_CONTAM: GDSL esterase/lipase [Sesamum radiatum]|uniref:GDSL esterase/lipase n=1 Tax=Sesamum radiatum TaxID=300843 RepID=A0AAW2K162_SESRA
MGDSLVDNGNNNFLLTTAKSNYLPYGIDYPGGPTGRFSNARNLADFLAEFLGFDNPIPPFATANHGDILRGLNYGSGGAGILDQTGAQLGDRISLNRQLQNHGVTVSKTTLLPGLNANRAREHLNKCLYIVNIGSNDYINNYLMPHVYPTSTLHTPDQFAEILIRQYSEQLRILYGYGARKIAIFGLGLLGCLPVYANGTACVESINSVVLPFNNRLRPLIDTLNTDLPDAQFIFIDSISISAGINPLALGVRVGNAPCCQVYQFDGLCVAGKVPCSNRDEYIFWDNFHPTEIFNRATAEGAYSAVLPSDAYPFDIRHLAQL